MSSRGRSGNRRVVTVATSQPSLSDRFANLKPKTQVYQRNVENRRTTATNSRFSTVMAARTGRAPASQPIARGIYGHCIFFFLSLLPELSFHLILFIFLITHATTILLSLSIARNACSVFCIALRISLWKFHENSKYF